MSTLAEALLKNGHEVQIISTAMDLGVEEIILNGDRLKFTIVKGSSSPRNRALTLFWSDRKRLRKAINKTQADVFHAHWTYEFALAALKCKKKVLVSAHDAPIEILRYYRDPYRFLRLLLSIIVRLKCKNLAAVSPYLASKWKKQMFWSNEIQILSNLIPSDFSERVPQNFKKYNKVLCIADGFELKNVKTLIYAWQIIRRTVSNYSLILVGPGLGNDQLRKWAVEKKLDEQIEWRGYVNRSEILNLIETSKIYCHPSLEESHCLAILEALSCGLPVVAGKDSGAIPWSVGDAGILVNVQSPQEIARAITTLIESPKLRESLGNKGIKYVQTNFTSEVLLEKYISSYKKIINQKL